MAKVKAKNWLVSEAVEAVRSGNVEVINDIVRRFPNFCINVMTEEGLIKILSMMPDYITVRKIEMEFKRTLGEDTEVDEPEVEEAEEEVEEEKPKPKKATKKASKKSKKKAEPEPEDDDDEDDEEEEVKPKKKSKKAAQKKASKKKPEPEPDEDDDDDWDDWDI